MATRGLVWKSTENKMPDYDVQYIIHVNDEKGGIWVGYLFLVLLKQAGSWMAVFVLGCLHLNERPTDLKLTPLVSYHKSTKET